MGHVVYFCCSYNVDVQTFTHRRQSKITSCVKNVDTNMTWKYFPFGTVSDASFSKNQYRIIY